MPVKVIDASALAALLFGEPDADKVLARIEGNTLAAPALLPFEIASVCLKKMRLHPERGDLLLAALRMLPEMEIDSVEVDLPDAVLLAQETQLTIYDSAYLWLARTLECDLIALDKQLASAAKPA
ncbi:MAG: type II toxin-antitoxin system VapC family toxin [Burkholderiales bacterium]